ncbi:hypothetical protein Tco_1565866 [Tanacetum coccineum]
MKQAPTPPGMFQELLNNKHFMENIRAYNQLFAMTSFGAKNDDSVNKGMGPYVFKLYIYDTHNEVSNRMHHFRGTYKGSLDSEIVDRLIYILNEHNELVQLFRTAKDKCRDASVPDFKIRMYNMGGVRGYELITSQGIGEIVFESGPRNWTDYDVIIELRGGPPQRINKLYQSYMSLQFSLLFVFGQPGYYPKLKLKPRDGNGQGKKFLMNKYYKYQLQPRVNDYGLIFRGGRFFQQYVVTVVGATLTRISFIF